MAHTPGRTVLRRQLGRELKQLRLAAGKTIEEAAAWSGLQKPTISKIENGRQAIRPTNVRLLAQLYSVSPEHTEKLLMRATESSKPSPWATYADTMEDSFSRFADLERDAELISGYGTDFVPGLLQTEAYIRAVSLAAQPDIDATAFERRVDFRLARQRHLLEGDPPHLRFVLSQGVVDRQVGGRDVHRAQLEALIEAASQDYVDLHLIPKEVGAHPAMGAPFTLLSFADEELNFVYLEHIIGATYLEDPEDFHRCMEILGGAIDLALSCEKTVDWLAKVVRHL